MEITGKVIALLAEQTGTGKNGTWRKREFILETDGKYPKKVCISAWGDKIDQFGLSEGQVVTASIELESREYNGRWYTEARAWKVAKQGAEGNRTSSSNAPPSIPAAAYTKAEAENVREEDLPF